MPKLGKTFKMTSTARKEIEKIIDERVKEVYVTKDDFNELKEIVKQLGEAQVNLTIRVSELAEAQRKTEERLNTLALRFDELTQKVSALAEAQRKTEERLNSLAQRFEELTQRVDNLAQRLDELTQRVDVLTQRVDDLTQRLDELTQRVDELTQRVNALAEAQIKIEERLNSLAQRFEELTQRVDDLAQRLDELTQRVDTLAEAQRKTEERLNSLALRVDELTQRVDALAEAQRKSEERINWLTQKIGELTDDIRALTNEMRDMRRRFGELSDSIGFGLEDRAYKVLPKLLKRDYGIDIKKILIRRFIKDKYGKDIEVNIFAHAEKDGQEITIIGECKSQLSKNDVENFIEYRLKRFEGVYPNIFPLVITYMESEPGVEEFVKQKEIAIYFSYELD